MAEHPETLIDDQPAAKIDPTLMIVPWVDPVVDGYGFDVHSEYVDVFWLGVLGPTSTWILRHLDRGLARYPLGFEADLVELAAMLGLSSTLSTSSPFVRALNRCEMFGVARRVPGAMAVRRRLPRLSVRQLARLPDSIQAMHRTWQRRPRPDESATAQVLAGALVEVGHDAQSVERCLLALGVAPSVAQHTAAGAAVSAPG